MRDDVDEPLRATPVRDTLTLVEPLAFGRYTLIAQIGSGGSGDVFLALSSGPTGFQKLIVLKVSHEEFSDDPAALEMFFEEARIAGRLQHPNIVQIFEADVADGRHYIAMEYVAGLGLDWILREGMIRQRAMPVAFCVRVVSEILAALIYAHNLVDFAGAPIGVVHRDISPANILVGWDGTVKLVDFGIATVGPKTRPGGGALPQGRLAYMAPEQARGEVVGPRADIFGVGVVLFELLTGQRLFPTNAAALKAFADGPIRTVLDVRPDIPAVLSDIVAMALQQDPAERYPSAARMRQDLESWLATEKLAMNRDDLAAMVGDYFEGERERQHMLIGESVGGLPLTATHTGSFAVPPPSLPAEDELVPAKRPPAPRRLPFAPLALATLLFVAALILALTR